VEVVPVVAGQRSVREKEWLETLKIFGIETEDGKRIIHRLRYTILNDDEKLFGRYCRQTNVGGGNLMKTSSCESSVGKNSSLENCSQVFKVQVLNVVYVWSGRDVFFSSSVPYSSVASPEPVTEEVASVAVIEA
jgi:hypothetical protein